MTAPRGSPGRRLSVFVTVGMGPWPFDRLVEALAPVCARHDVFAQTGTSTVVPPCPHAAFIGYEETQRRIAQADVVVTHGGNTVRLVQRAGKIPIAVAREAARGEMRNDHQVRYLTGETAAGRVVELTGDLAGLGPAVEAHPQTQAHLLRTATALDTVAPEQVTAVLEAVPPAGARPGNPFARHPTARYRWAYEQLRDRAGRHLELGIGDASFLRGLDAHTALDVTGADPHAGYLADAARRSPHLPLIRVGDRLPFCENAFDSVSLLDVLEHTRDEATTLAEVHRVLRPGGLLVLTVPARHALSFLDPDNVKFRSPRLHRAVYSARFGETTYRQRFVDAGDGLRGDLAWERHWHTSYRAQDVLALLGAAGFVPRLRDGANLFWRLWQVPALLAPAPARRLFDLPLRADGRLFRRANLFLTAERDGG